MTKYRFSAYPIQSARLNSYTTHFRGFQRIRDKRDIRAIIPNRIQTFLWSMLIIKIGLEHHIL